MLKRNVFLVVLCALVLAGCATGLENTRSDVTPMERAKMQSLLMMERYKTQLKDAQMMGVLAQQGKLTEAQRDVYRVKRNILIDVERLIKEYDGLIGDGFIPPADKEQRIFDALNRLGTLAE